MLGFSDPRVIGSPQQTQMRRPLGYLGFIGSSPGNYISKIFSLSFRGRAMSLEANPAECHILPWILGIYKNVDKPKVLKWAKEPA